MTYIALIVSFLITSLFSSHTDSPLSEKPMQTLFSTFTPKFGKISFDYPSGWEVGRDDRKSQPFNENYFIQPKGQNFSAAAGEVVLRTFDPVSIIEDTKSLEAGFSQTLFDKFVTSISEGARLPSRIITRNGATFYETVQSNQGYEVKTVGARTPSGNLCVVSMAAAPTISAENDAILYRVARSLHGGEPTLVMNTQETVLSKWYKAVGQGNRSQLDALSCSSAVLTQWLVQWFLSGAGSLDDAIMAASHRFNFSHLGFYMIGGNDNTAVVRVCGNIVAPGGGISSIYNYSHRTGGSNLFVLRREGGQWKICESMR